MKIEFDTQDLDVMEAITIVNAVLAKFKAETCDLKLGTCYLLGKNEICFYSSKIGK